MMCANFGVRGTSEFASHLRAVEVLRRRRTPDGGLARRPSLGPLRRVVVPRARLEVAELLVLHLVELAEELDDLPILVAMIGGDVVSGPVPQRTPNDRDPLLSHRLARILQMHEVLELERDVVKLGLGAAEKIHGVMIGIAT